MLEEDKRGILLESGTNEIEVMQFTINNSLYGINVAKVKEIIVSAPVKSMPHAHPAVEGIFKPRDLVITVVDLPRYLLGIDTEKGPKDLFIVTNFNKMNIAFRVHTVVGISRISWKDIRLILVTTFPRPRVPAYMEMMIFSSSMPVIFIY